MHKCKEAESGTEVNEVLQHAVLHLQIQQLGFGHIITSVGTKWSISEY